MEHELAVERLAALGQTHRLGLFRRLMRAGPSGLPAGVLAGECALQPSALSFHIGQLEKAGLVTSWRRGRNIFYAVAIEEMRRLMVHLTEDCCDGHPEICGGLSEAIANCSDCEVSP
ncbi:ArsR/SmtB family transcription factor [Microbaculum marinum]|uniref:Helix-turn-helix domain-containing protein n=1 Tax=Microbaculum marinum TaxID=1764581 RepID=A0AAW9RNR9_9HYPH